MKAMLVVDDSMTVRKQLGTLSDKFGANYQVVEASSGEEALKKVGSIRDILVCAVLDYNMAGIKGLDVAQQLLKQKVLAAELIFLLTANTQHAVTERAKQMGIKVIEKPLTTDKFKQILDAVEGVA